MNEFQRNVGFYQIKTIGLYHLLKSKKNHTLRIRLLKNKMVPQNIAVKSRMLFQQKKSTL